MRGEAKPLARRGQQHAGRRKAAEGDVRRCLTALNSLYTGDPVDAAVEEAPPGAALSAVQRLVLSRVEESVRQLGPPPAGLSEGEALRALRLGQGYSEESGGPSPYVASGVALPEEGSAPIALSRLWGAGGDEVVAEFIRSRTVLVQEARRALRLEGPQRPYGDPLLRDPGTYGGFLRRLVASGVVEITREPPTEIVDIFFVGKSDNRLRPVIDCRRSNRYFVKADGVALASGDSRLEISRGSEMVVGQVDIKDAFYRMELPQPLRHLFGLRRIRSRDLRLGSPDAVELEGHQFLYPRLTALPMGWSWALWWCQGVHQRAVESAGLSAATRMRDGVAPPGLGDYPHVEYVDNFAVMGPDRAGVEVRLRAVSSELRR